jgi:hypothetical protein
MPMSTAILLAAGAISFFAFFTVSYWANTRAAERRTQERYALLRQIADRPAESAQLVIELLREEDARLDAKARQKLVKARQDSILGGWILVAVGVGMAIMMASVADDQPNLWTIGLLPGSIGVAMIAFEVVSGRRQGRETTSKP